MKLIIFIDDLFTGGTELTLYARLLHLPKDWELKILVLYAKGPVADMISNMKFDIELIDLKKMGYYKGIKKIQSITHEFQPDKLIFFRDVARGLLPFFIKYKNAETFLFWDSTVIYRSFKQFCAELFQVTFVKHKKICSSSAIAHKLKKYYWCNKPFVLHNCYDEKRYYLKNINDSLQKEDGLCRILSVGNMRSEKNHLDKLKIASILKKNNFAFKLDIVGRGDFSSLKKLRDKYNLHDEVSFLGEIKYMNTIIHQYDIFLMTSIAEGCPVSLLEAMGTGLPCVSYEYNGIDNIDPNGDFIIKVESLNPNEAAERIQLLMQDKQKLKLLSQNIANYTLKNFSSQINASLWWNYFKNSSPLYRK